MGKKDKATQDQSFAAPAPTTASSASSILGPLDVQQKEFRVSRFGGYKMRDVDEFLDRITDSMSALTVENERLRKGAPPSIVGTPDLADVSRQADEIIERARAEAARIVAEAKATGAQPTKEPAAGASPEERAAVNAFLTREREFLQSLAGLVQEHAEQVRGMAKTAKRAPAPTDTPPAAPRAPKTEEAPTPKAEAAPTPPAPAATTSPAAATPPAAAPVAPKPKPAEDRPTAPEPTVRIEDPEPASVGRSDSEGDPPAESDRSLRDLFWGEE
jgi:DivIVA domain-containing protein